MNVGDFIKGSEALSGVKGYYVSPDDILELYNKLDMIERRSLVYHYIMDNSPYAFTMVYEEPLLFEQVRQYISHVLDVEINHIKLIGSSKTGFCMDSRHFGREYVKGRDLDFLIIDENLFSALEKEFQVWKKSYIDDRILKPSNNEKKYWDDNIKLLFMNLERGFVDTNKMPNRPNFLPINSKVNNTMYCISRSLETQYGFEKPHASVRVYKDVDCFFSQQNLNIRTIMDRILSK